ncbi:MAG: hypothetical protein DMG65_05735 [Candidatus Angelobacter sp. Gp1-AA117]|nr:MAG: hypothetical protein DMG65_05735 [Candidatus Angelobacter sp. Gp1-AA117]
MKRLIEFIRDNKLFFLLCTLAALALRLFFVFRYPHVAGDSFVYGDIAKNWLNHGIYGLTDGPDIRPTLIRLPGYPTFLALMFSIFGQEHYHAVMVAQALIDTNTCLVIAALALELMNARTAKAAYGLAALCPFVANYSAAPLSETLAVFCTAHALYYGIRGLKELQGGQQSARHWCFCGLWTAAAIYMRPDNLLLLVPFGTVLLFLMFRPLSKNRTAIAGTLLLLTSLGPLIPWTVRNWKTFHIFQPLASRYADDPGEFVPLGFNHWIKTWTVDFVSVDEVFWHVSGESISMNSLPERAFDSRPEYEATEKLIAAYNQQLYIDPALDWQFELLARERMNHNPFRYYLWLPALRIADMWLRPRTEMLPVDPRWWEFSNDPKESAFSFLWAVLNLLLLLAALRGWISWRLGLYGFVLAGFVLVRSLFLGTLENPEPRYMLECFPVVLVFAAGAFTRSRQTTTPSGST